MSAAATGRAADKDTSDAAGDSAANGDDAATYYLGFDCATKTFGFSLIAIHAARFLRRRNYLRQRVRELKGWIAERPTDPTEIKTMFMAVSDIEAESKGYIEILDGETKDLVPAPRIKRSGRFSESKPSRRTSGAASCRRSRNT